MAESEECLIKSLLADPFSERTFDEQKYIINAGRPTPALPNLTNGGVKFTRHFQTSMYKRCIWLTGSNDLNALFCWNCLLFSTDRVSSWTKTGFTNLSNLFNAINRHEVSVGHLRASLSLSHFCLSNEGTAPEDDPLETKTSLHSGKIRRNKEVLKRLIEAVIFLAKQELSLSGLNESESSNKKGNYEELLTYTAKYDPLLADHLENSTVFKGTSDLIQNDIIEACGETVLMAIKEELSEVHFVAMLVDETTDVSTEAEFSIILRYVHKGEIKERFLGFSDISKNKSAGAIVEKIRQYLTEFACNEKLVAQAYSGAPILADHVNYVQAQLKDTHPFALYVYSYAYDLSQVLSKNLTLIPECKIFFSSANGIANFFSGSTKRTKFLYEFLFRRLPQVCPTQWNCSSQLVNTLYENRFQLKNVFEVMLAFPDEIEADILAPVCGFSYLLDDFQFNFLLKTFYTVFAYTDVFFDSLQDQLFDILYCRKKIAEVQQNIAALRDDFENVYQDTKELVGEPTERKNYERLYDEVIATVGNKLETLFQDYGKLKFLSLLSHQKFKAYQWAFPYDLFKNLMDSYSKFFDENRLKNELTVVYSSEEFSCKTVPEIAKMLTEVFLKNNFPQLNLLVSLLYTIPVSTASINRSDWTLNKVKKYSQNATGEERFSHLSLLSIEKDLITKLKRDQQFNEDIINTFCKNKRYITEFLHQ